MHLVKVCVTLLLSISFFLGAEALKVDVSAESAVLMNAENGRILFAKNPQVLLYPASTTKISTALYALKFHRHELDRVLTASRESLSSISAEEKKKSNYKKPAYWLEPDGSHIGLQDGEQMVLRDMLFAMMVASGNDAANVIAESLSGSVPNYMDKVNRYLKEIGCTNTKFLNPHGLHHPQHQTTATDLALMTKVALKDSLFKEIVSTVRFTRPKTNLQKASTLLQTNKLLRPGKLFYSKAIGVKTGYHSLAKHNIVAAAESNGRTLIAVLLKAPDRTELFEDATKIFEAAFKQEKVQKKVLAKGPQVFSASFVNTDKPLKTYLEEDLTISFYPSEDPHPKSMLYWNVLMAPINKGDRVGEIKLVADNGDLIKIVPLLAQNEVRYTWPLSWISKARSFIFYHPFFASLLFIFALFVGVSALMALTRTRR